MHQITGQTGTSLLTVRCAHTALAAAGVLAEHVKLGGAVERLHLDKATLITELL